MTAAFTFMHILHLRKNDQNLYNGGLDITELRLGMRYLYINGNREIPII